MRVRIEKPKKSNYWIPLAFVVLIAAALVLWPRFVTHPSAPLAFEVTSFEGDVQIYDLESHVWRIPKRGEEFRTTQKIKTGADGNINFQVENELRLRLKENSELKNEESCIRKQKELYKLDLTQGVLFGATSKQFDRKLAAQQAFFQVITPDFATDVHGAVFRVQAGGPKGEENKVGVLRGSVEVAPPSLFFQKSGIRIRGLEKVNVIEGVPQPAVRVSPEEWGVMKEAYELLEKTAVMEAEQIDLSKHAGSLFNHVFDHGTFYTPKIGYAGREFFKDPDTGDVLLETEYDVFPTGSFVGVYIKTRDFDAAQYSGLSFEVRRNPEEGVPDSFFIELKSKGNVVRRFAPKGFERKWTPMKFDFHAQKSTPVTEIVFVFVNARVGEAKKGVLEFRNINLIPLPASAKPPLGGVKKTVPASSKPAVLPQPPKPTAVQASNETPSAPKEVPLQ